MKKYTAPTVEAALAAIRAELGPNAVIVRQAPVKRGPLGMLSRGQVEVVAAVDDAPRPAQRPLQRAAPTPAQRARASSPSSPAAPRPAGPRPGREADGRPRPRAGAPSPY